MSPAATMRRDESESAVLAAADTLFYARGIAGVGMAEVRDASGVSLRRLYALYPSKRDLVAAWLDDRHLRWMQWFTSSVARLTTTGTEPLLATFDAIAEWVHSPGYRGCAFLNAIAETTEIDDAHRAIVAGHKRDLIEHLATLATTAHPDAPVWLPEAIGALLDGAIVQTAVFGTDAPLLAARQCAAQLLNGIS
ncbi:MAG: TetR/AcrR family transcriptional regulator [Ilumatobacteraceae bacterium]